MPPIGRSACLTKLDNNGAVVWNNAYSVLDVTRGAAVRRATDDPTGYVLVGTTETTLGFASSIYVIRTDGAGAPLWTFTYGTDSAHNFMDKVEIKNCDTGYIVTGTVMVESGLGVPEIAGFLLRIDDAGALQWMRIYSQVGVTGFADGAFKDVHQNSVGFVVTGHGVSQFPSGPTQNARDTILFQTDTLGMPLWGKQYANLEGNNSGESLAITADGYAIVGGHLPPLIDNYTTELLSTDSTGNLNWYRRIFTVQDGGSHYQSNVANGTLRVLPPNDELVFVGGTGPDSALLRYDFTGTLQSAQSYDNIGQFGASFLIEPSGGFTLTGPSSNGLNRDYSVIRTDANFLSGCHEGPFSPPSDTPPIEVVDIEYTPINVDVALDRTPVVTPLVWIETVLCQSSICVDPAPIICTLTALDVVITWDPAPVGVVVELWRDGVLLAFVPDTTYTDTPGPGAHTYELHLVDPNPDCDPAISSCSLLVPSIISATATDVLVDFARPTIDEIDVCIADALESVGRSPITGLDLSSLTDLGAAQPDVTPIAWLQLGEFPAQHALTQAEGDQLAQFLSSGGSLYIEGADVAFDPPTALSSMDGVVGVDDGDVFGQVPGVVGLDSGVGFDATAFSASYRGSGRSIDHLSPDGAGAGALFENGGGEGQTTAVFYDATVTGGTHRVLTSSTSLEGYDGDTGGWIAGIVVGLSPPTAEPQFVRGECNGDGLYDIADGIYTLSLLFTSGPDGPCQVACDANGDALIDLADAITTFSYLLLSGTPPAAPFPNCGGDSTGVAVLGCAVSGCP